MNSIYFLVEGYKRCRNGPIRTCIDFSMGMSANGIKRLDDLTRKISNSASKTWWGDGDSTVHFHCTSCGKCCTNDGEVWMNTDEFADLVMQV